MTDEAMTPLHRRMIEDISVRNFIEKTQKDYIRPRQEPRSLSGSIAGHDNGRGSAPLPATPDRQRHAFADLNGTVSALRFFFCITVDRPNVAKPLTFVAEPRKLPVVLSPEEVARFLEGRSTRPRSVPPMMRACAFPRWSR
jgi:integrase/recombinase XerD